MSRRRVLTAATLAVTIWIVSLNGCAMPLRAERLLSPTLTPVVDAQLELARRYAPWVYHAVHPVGGRQDIPAPVDFDGDMDGENNWENFPRYELRPTLSYSVLETRSHWFLTYHVFHPRDWTWLDLGLHLTHEGDGENLQVVVDKQTGQVVLLFTQAHYRGVVHARPGAGFADGEQSIHGPLVLVDDEGLRDVDGHHAAVFVEWGGHGIHALESGPLAEATAVGSAPRFDADAHMLVLRPAEPGERVREPTLPASRPVPYQLESTTAKLWPALAAGRLVGEGRLLDGAVRYEGHVIQIDVPRYHEADRFSGPFGPDRGISPFAVDFDFCPGEVGALFFEPAMRYAECLVVPEPWSLEWIDYPFVP